ncbi:MAG: protein-ADP-ribose hydrolase [Erysipelotrichaceae bacterium]
MNQSERRLYLINYLLNENRDLKDIKIPEDKYNQELLLRSLMNIRMPEPINDVFLKVQDEYLKERNNERGITEIKSDKRIILWQGDIATLKCDAIVNACNSKMLGCSQPLHSCIDNCIHTYAGIQLRLKMKEIMDAQGHDEPSGQAKITSAYNLPSKYILHTVGPVYCGYLKKEDEITLSSCYAECLKLCEQYNIKTIAFCCISTGVFGFPKRIAAKIAVNTVKQFLEHNSSIDTVIFNVFNDDDREIYSELLKDAA